MQYNRIGETDLHVSQLCLGTMTWGQQNTEAEAHAQLDYAVAHGINFIDTAEMYPVPPRAETACRTERYLGNWLKRQPRDRLVVATKIAGPGRRDWLRGGKTALTRANIREAVEGSLARLQTDYIDLYQIHWPDRNVQMFGASEFNPRRERETVPILEQIEAFAELIREGKIRYYGLSNESAWGLARFCWIADRHGLPRPASIQNVYNLVSRQFDTDLAEASFRERVPLLAYSPLAGGRLSGKYLDGARPENARFTLFPDFQPRNSRPAVAAAVAEYAALARRRGLPLDQMALAFVRQRWFVAATIIGATTLEQLRRNIDSVNLTLDAETLADIDAIHARYSTPAP
ncbi:MAG TPA: NADP(H)-dependent aldo-keto reductase [Burkholderiales bacterium]